MAKQPAKTAAQKAADKKAKAAKTAANKEHKDSEDKAGLTVKTGKQHKSSRVKPGKRLWLNKAKDTLYPEGHAEAATLYCTEHKEVPRAEYESLKKGK